MLFDMYFELVRCLFISFSLSLFHIRFALVYEISGSFVIASVGLFEAVGQAYFLKFFSATADLIGVLSLVFVLV